MASPLVSYSSLADLKKSLVTLGPYDDAGFDALVQRGLPPIISARAFGAILGVNPKLLTAMAKFPSRYYRHFAIPRKSGGERVISAPRTFLKTVQRYILINILNRLRFGPHVTGFVRGRGISDNGNLHRRAPFLLNVDIENFFGSVQERQVRQVFEKLGFNADVSKLLTKLCTLDGSLPQGAPTSPALANVVFEDADSQILSMCAPPGIRYSRYADDLTFSADGPIERSFVRIIGALLSLQGFRLNGKKTRFAKPGQAKYVTGFVVNERVHPQRELRRKLRAMFHQASLNPESFAKQSNFVTGWASFVNSYDKELGTRYLRVAREVQLRALHNR